MSAVIDFRTDTAIGWAPVKNTSSAWALWVPANIICYHGTRGAMKTATQLARFFRNVGVGYGSAWRGVILDREFKDLGGIVAEASKMIAKLYPGVKFLRSPQAYSISWPTGEELFFRHVKKEIDYEHFHGWELPFIGWNELTKHGSATLYEKMQSVNRASFNPLIDTPRDDYGDYRTANKKPLAPIPLEQFLTTNPRGPGHLWVKRKFIDAAPPGKLIRVSTNIYNPKTRRNEDIERSQVTIFGSWRENPYLDPSYIAYLNNINDPVLRRAWTYGHWDGITGNAFDDVYSRNLNVIPRFAIPYNWKLYRAIDWGSSKPFAIGWYAIANGETVSFYQHGRLKHFSPARGSVIFFAEWYGSREIGSNVGVKLGSVDVAKGIILRERSLRERGWIERDVSPGPADTQIGKVDDSSVLTIRALMEREGVRWEEAWKAKGSREIGFDVMRQMFLNARTGELPALYFMDNCRAAIETISVLERDPENQDDIAEDSEDHAYDMVRYAICKKGVTAQSVKMRLPL